MIIINLGSLGTRWRSWVRAKEPPIALTVFKSHENTSHFSLYFWPSFVMHVFFNSTKPQDMTPGKRETPSPLLMYHSLQHWAPDSQPLFLLLILTYPSSSLCPSWDTSPHGNVCLKEDGLEMTGEKGSFESFVAPERERETLPCLSTSCRCIGSLRHGGFNMASVQ